MHIKGEGQAVESTATKCSSGIGQRRDLKAP